MSQLPNIVVPFGQPCPSGYVSQGAGMTSHTDLQAMIDGALASLPALTQIETGACVPAPTVSTVGQWITADDFLAVRVKAAVPTAGLTLTTRTLDCQGKLYYSQTDLSHLAQGAFVTVVLPLTPGYLLDVCVSNCGSGWVPGNVWVIVSLQHSFQSGLPPWNILAQGYVTDMAAVSWPAVTTGSLYTAPTPQPGAGGFLILQHKSGLENSAAALTLTLPLAVTAGSLLVANATCQGINVLDAVTDNQGNTWTMQNSSLRNEMFSCFNAKAGLTKVTYTPASSAHPYDLQVVEIAGMAASAPVVDCGVQTGASATTVTATTPSTGHLDVAVAAAVMESLTPWDFSGQSGWTLLENIWDGQSRRLALSVAQSVTQPPAPSSYTALVSGGSGGVYVGVVLYTFIIAGG